MTIIRLNNCDIYYEALGDKRNQPIVLLHAFPLDHKVWRPQAEALSKEYLVVTPDFRGHGLSEATDEPYSMDLFANDLHALVKSLGLKNIIIGGISMGGYVAFAYTRRFPEDFQALILVDTKAEADTPKARLGRKELADLVQVKGVSAFADQMLPRLFSKESLTLNRQFVRDARKTIESMKPAGIVGSLQGLADRLDSAAYLEKIRAPTLIVVGAKDEVTTPEDAKKMEAGIVGSKLVMIPYAGHISSLEQADRVTKEIQAFLQRIRLAR